MALDLNIHLSIMDDQITCDGAKPYLSMDRSFTDGIEWGLNRYPFHSDDWEHFANIRTKHGFAHVKAPTLLTPPEANEKLAKVKTYGLTLQSSKVKLGAIYVDSCANAGRCAKACVLKGGNGAYPKVQAARDARTEYLVDRPEQFSFHLGLEGGRAIRRHGEVMLRPNVNSDVKWLDVIPSMATTEGLTCYGYTKHHDPVLMDRYVEAYSLNESTPFTLPQKLTNFGVSIAAVTNRKKGQPVKQWARDILGIDVEVVDADENDLWMVDAARLGVPVVGDLSAKGRARKLIGTEQVKKGDFITGRFVQNAY